MKPFPSLATLMIPGALFMLAGCSTLQPGDEPEPSAAEVDVDQLEPMPAATEITLDPALAAGIVEPPPEEPEDAEGDLWERMRAGFQLDLDQDNRRIRTQREWYANNPAYLDRVSERGKRYLHYILDELEEADLPLELALLPVVESAFDPFAYSHGQASGPWQFIGSTGRNFGMDQDYWQDGRRDIIRSTEGAVEYLELLSERFDGDWELALASYNVGAGHVSRAVRRNRNAGQGTDYWSLQLPRETMAYVPKLIALAQIIADPEAHDVELKSIPDEPYFEIVEMEHQIDMKQAGELADVSVEELYMLNAHINQWATPPDGPHRLLVPVDHAEDFRERLAEVPEEERMHWEEYIVQSGDTLEAIAQRYNTTPEMIRGTNDLNSNTIVVGDTLLLPAPAGEGEDYSLSEEERLAASQNSGSGQRIRHRVQSGESLWSIARKYDTSVDQVASTNNMAPDDVLRSGQEVVVRTSNAARGGQGTIEGQPDMIRRIQYAVRTGDSLHRIANRFNVSVSDIQNWNGIDGNSYLHPGDRLELYVDIREAR